MIVAPAALRFGQEAARAKGANLVGGDRAAASRASRTLCIGHRVAIMQVS
jgi:hypothetical protein